jgi:cytochrome c5
MSRLLLCAGVLLVAACGPDPGSPTAAAAGPTPSDPKLAKLYAQTCKACHTTPGSGAPLAGDTAAWEPRVGQGMPALLEHTVRGYKGMPPLGSCMDCTEKEFEALIRFMAGLDGA